MGCDPTLNILQYNLKFVDQGYMPTDSVVLRVAAAKHAQTLSSSEKSSTQIQQYIIYLEIL